MASRTGSRLASAFLGYLVGVAALVTLVPFDFAVPPHFRMLWGGTALDTLSNVVMFVPLGFLFRLTRAPQQDRWALTPLAAGLALSTLIETSQLFLHTRYSSPLDVLANGSGAWLGALAHDRIAGRIRFTPALVGALALELPLMGLVYLLIPLLWLSGLAAAGDAGRLSLSILLGLMGAVVLGAIYRHRVAPARAVSLGRFSALAGGWFLIGALPGLVERPLAVLGTALLVSAATGVWGGSWARESAHGDRRFEGATLAGLAPVLGLYLFCLGACPPWAPFVGWHGETGLREFWGAADTRQILRALEHLAAFTVLGYAVAESRGRQELTFAQSVHGVGCWSLAAAAALEVAAAIHPGAGASALRGLLAVGTALYGAGIYYLQRSHIRWLLRATREETLSDVPRSASARTPPDPAGSGRTEAPAWAGRTD